MGGVTTSLVGNFSPGSIIKSIQRGTITIASGANSNTATISSVDTTKAAVTLLGFSSANDTAFDASQTLPAVVLTNATTVTASTGTSDGSNARIVSYEVVEFQSWAVTSIQTGTVTISNSTTVPSTNTATISSVDTARSALFFGGCTFDDNSAVISNIYQNLTLTNATTVTGRVSQGPGASSVSIGYFTIVQFALNIVRSVQQATITIATSQTTGTASISAVTTANCVFLFRGIEVPNAAITGTTSDTTRYPYAYLSSSTQVSAVRGAASGALSSSIYVTVLEFYPQFVVSRQSGETAIASGQTQQANTISAVTVNKSITSPAWFATSTNTTASPGKTFPRTQLVSTTSMQQNRGVSEANTVTGPWGVTEMR